MIALTQEKREELIAWAMEHIEHLKQDTKSTYAKNCITSLEITLASLTAEPEYWSIVDRIFSTKEEALAPGFIGEPEPLFACPPVPEIKLPDDREGIEHTEYLSGKQDGWNGCLAEIKLLNGLGE